MKGGPTAHSDVEGVPPTRHLRHNGTVRNQSDGIPADSNTSSKRQEQRVSNEAAVVGVSKIKPQKREFKRPKQITGPSAIVHRHPAAPPRNAASVPPMPAPVVLLKKHTTNPQRFSLQASAPEFVPQSAATTSVPSPFGMAAWPSLPQSSAAVSERVLLPKPQHRPTSPVVTAPQLPKVNPSGSRPLSSSRVEAVPARVPHGTSTDSHAPTKLSRTNVSLASMAPSVMAPPPPSAEGSHFELVRLFQEGKLTDKKGRQRLTPRKKKFSSLKKKVLDERLRQWKLLQGISETDPAVPEDNDDAASEPYFTTLCIYGFCSPDELADDDEYDEIVDNLQAMASKIGAMKRVFVPRQGAYDSERWPVFVQFDDSVGEDAPTTAAVAAVRCWTGLVLGGQQLSCRPMPNVSSEGTNFDDDMHWQNACLAAEASWAVPDRDQDVVADAITSTTILLDNALTEEDLVDEDCLAESLSDIRSIASKFGAVESVHVQANDGVPSTQLRIVYRGDARRAVSEWNQVVIGGQQLVAVLEKDGMSSSHRSFCVRLQNIITDDDLEDDACLEESLNDLRELAGQFGRVENVDVDRPTAENKIHDPKEYSIQVFFSTLSEAQSAVAGFDGMVIGGSRIVAAIDENASEGLEGDTLALDDIVKGNGGLEPMYSGDKLIPERFAECKRAPKVAGRTSARPYAKLASDETIKTTIIEMLSELMRLQRRALEENNVKAKRRLVMGLREVARGIRSHKVKLVIMANNLDEYGAIDATIQSIIDLAQKEDVPIYYELNKKALGKAVGKSIKIAVVGVQSPEGAHQQYKKLISYASTSG